MARFKLFPRNRRPSQLLDISQAERQVSRKHQLRIVRDVISPLKNAEHHAKRRAGYYGPPMQLARFLHRLFASSAPPTPAPAA